ncbi:MAG: tryptophan--tRNA ligase [Candidatus Anstonellales archaeon]
MMIIDPWRVEGDIDYDRLIEEFGTKRLDVGIFNTPLENLPVMLRRGFFFSHRDLDVALRDGFFIYTGRGPSGKMHIGHLPPFLLAKWLQDRYGANLYIMISDDEKFVYNREIEWKEIDRYAIENIRDIASIGFDPNRTFIFRDTEYIRNMYRLSLEIARKINLSTAKAVFGFTGESNLGLIFYTALQTVPTMFERNVPLIPAGIDQDPYWRVQRDIAESLGYRKVSAIHNRFFPSLMGPGSKMSSSKPETVIFLDETRESLRKKIYRAFSGGQPTVELHRKLGGDPNIDVPFQLLYYMFEDDDNKIREIYDRYRSGEMLTGELKDYAIERIWGFLERLQRNRRSVDIDKYMYDGKLASEMWNRYF